MRGRSQKRLVWIARIAVVGIVILSTANHREIQVQYYLHRIRTEPEALAELVRSAAETPQLEASERYLGSMKRTTRVLSTTRGHSTLLRVRSRRGVSRGDVSCRDLRGRRRQGAQFLASANQRFGSIRSLPPILRTWRCGLGGSVQHARTRRHPNCFNHRLEQPIRPTAQLLRDSWPVRL